MYCIQSGDGWAMAISLAHKLIRANPGSQVICMLLYEQEAFVTHCMTWTRLAITDAPGVSYWLCANTSQTHCEDAPPLSQQHCIPRF